MKIHHIIYFILFGCLISCSSGSQKSTKDIPFNHFSEVYSIKHKKLNITPEKLPSQGNMILYEKEGFLIKDNFKGGSLIDKIYYNADSVVSIARLGEGPDDFLFLQISEKEPDGSILAIDSRTRKIHNFSPSGKRLSSLKIDNTPFNVIRLDTFFITSLFNYKYENKANERYTLLDRQGQVIRTFGDFPNDGIELSNALKMFAYQGSMAGNRQNGRIAFATRNGVILDIYEIGKDSIRPIALRHEIYAKYKDINIPGGFGTSHEKDDIFGSLDMKTTNNFIYILYSGKYWNKKTEGGLEDVLRTRHILIYDWEGNPVCQLETDINLMNICISEDDKQLIGFSYEDDFGLCSFDLSGINALKKK